MEKKSVLLQVMSPNRKGKKKKMKQSQIEIHHDKKLVVKLPQQQSESESGSSGPKRTSSPIVVLDDSDSSRNGRTRSATKRKSTEDSVPVKQKKEKREKTKEKTPKEKKKQEKQKEKPKKNSAKGTSNGSANGSANGCVPKKKALGDLTVDEFLKEDGLHKWRYLVDMASNDDCEAVDILINERRDAISAEIEKDLKKAEKKDSEKKNRFKLKKKKI